MLSPAVTEANFVEFNIKYAMKRIILEHNKHDKIYTFRDAAIDDMGVHANFQAYSDQGDLFASQRSIDAIKAYLEATGDCKGLTVTWFARPTTVPLEEIRTLLGVRAANETIVSSQCLPGDLDYVTDQLRSFSKTAS
jgi:hypothetical protein